MVDGIGNGLGRVRQWRGRFDLKWPLAMIRKVDPETIAAVVEFDSHEESLFFKV